MTKTNEIDAALNELATAPASETIEETTVVAPTVEPDTTATTDTPVTEQVILETIDTPASETEPITGQTTPLPDAVKLPDGYLEDGFMENTPDGKHRFLKRDYVNCYAKELAATLSTGTPSLTAAAFRSAFLRDAKKLLSRGTPDGAKLTAVATMEVQAIKLVSQNKAPAILVDMIAKAAAAVTDAETFQSLHAHLDAVHIFMLQIESQKGGK